MNRCYHSYNSQRDQFSTISEESILQPAATAVIGWNGTDKSYYESLRPDTVAEAVGSETTKHGKSM